jgi:hypothetical protein
MGERHLEENDIVEMLMETREFGQEFWMKHERSILLDQDASDEMKLFHQIFLPKSDYLFLG